MTCHDLYDCIGYAMCAVSICLLYILARMWHLEGPRHPKAMQVELIWLALADFAGRRQALGYVRPSSVATWATYSTVLWILLVWCPIAS